MPDVLADLEDVYLFAKQHCDIEVNGDEYVDPNVIREYDGPTQQKAYGRWNSIDGGWPYCTSCGGKAIEGKDGKPVKTKCCPHCGTDMGE